MTVKKYENTYIITLEPYAKTLHADKLVNDCKLLGLNIEPILELSREGEYVIKVLDNVPYREVVKYIRNLDYVCHIIRLCTTIEYTEDIDYISNLSRQVLQEAISDISCSTFKVLTKRIYKKFPLTSVDLNKELGARLIDLCRVNVVDPDCYVYVEIREDKILLGYACREGYVKARECVPQELISNIVALVDNPLTVYEIMDLVQFARALNLKLRLLDRTGSVAERLREACSKLGVKKVDVVELCEDVDECLRDVDVIVVLSQYARHGESLLEVVSEYITRGRKVMLVVGNEVEDVGLDIRDRAHYEVRLGPCTGQAMRSVIALSYAVGIILFSALRKASGRSTVCS